MSEDHAIGYFVTALLAYLFGRWVGRTSTLIQISRSLIENRADINRVLKKLDEELAEEKSKESELEAHEEIRVERHGEQLFLYTKDKDEFISQGSSLEEALERAERRFPTRSFKGHITKSQAEELGINVSKP